MQTSGKKSRVCKAFGRLRLTALVCVCCPPPSLPLFSDSNCCSVALIPNGQGLGSNRRPLHNLDTDTEGREPWQRESAVKYIEHFKSQWCIRCRQPPECDHIMVSSSLLGLTSDQETFQTINTVVSSAWNWSGGAYGHYWPITGLHSHFSASKRLRSYEFWFRLRHFNGTLYHSGWLHCVTIFFLFDQNIIWSQETVMEQGADTSGCLFW